MYTIDISLMAPSLSDVQMDHIIESLLGDMVLNSSIILTSKETGTDWHHHEQDFSGEMVIYQTSNSIFIQPVQGHLSLEGCK